LIVHPEFIVHSDNLQPSMFRNKENGCLYWAISELYKQSILTIDTFNLENIINSNSGVKNTISKFNDKFIEELIDMSVFVARETTEEYKAIVNKVIELSFKRDLYGRLTRFQKLCFDQEIELSELQKTLDDNIDDLVSNYIIQNNINTLNVDDLWQEICRYRNNNGSYGLPSKFKIVNNYFTYEESEVIVLAGTAKAGKSAFMTNEFLHKVENNIPSAYLDSEINDKLFFLRVLANVSGVNMNKIKTGEYTKSEAATIENAKIYIKNKNIIHHYEPIWTIDKIYSTVKLLINKMGLKFLVYDYAKDNSKESYQKLGLLLDFLKNEIAGKLNVAVLCGAQLNRAGDIAESWKIAQYCSTLATWSKKTVDDIENDGIDCGTHKFRVILNRSGESHFDDDYISFNFTGSNMRIFESKQRENFEL